MWSDMAYVRAVPRLTLVKGWNMAEVANYAKLVALGQPDFIEVKGVTYCGSSGASSLTMQNVPYHQDVCAFGEVRSHTQQHGMLACTQPSPCIPRQAPF